MTKQQTWSELDLDALTELLNISVGKAAASLSAMIDDEIDLSIPQIQIMNAAELIAIFDDDLPDDLASIRESYKGELSGDALLLFPQHRSLELARALLKNSVDLDDISDLAQEALCEIGNVVLNACLGTFSNLLNSNLTVGLPTYHKCSSSSLSQFTQADDRVFLFKVEFHIHRSDLDGHLLLFMRSGSEAVLHRGVMEFIGELA